MIYWRRKCNHPKNQWKAFLQHLLKKKVMFEEEVFLIESSGYEKIWCGVIHISCCGGDKNKDVTGMTSLGALLMASAATVDQPHPCPFVQHMFQIILSFASLSKWIIRPVSCCPRFTYASTSNNFSIGLHERIAKQRFCFTPKEGCFHKSLAFNC